MSKDNLSRRAFVKMASALAATGMLAWVLDKSDVEAKGTGPVIGVDPAETGGDETAFFPGLDKVITTGHIGAPFAPYHLDPDSDMWKVELPHFRGFNDERED